MTGFQRLTHHGGVAGTVEGEIGAAVGQRDQMRNDVAIELLRIDEMRHAEAAAPFLLAVIEIDADDLVGADHPRALNHVEPDTAQPEHHHVGARRDLGGVDHRTDARRHAAADVAALVERRVLADFCHRDFRQHGEIRKRRAAHIMEDRLALVAEARGAVGHQPLALGGTDGGAKIGFLAEAAFALAAFGRVERDDMIARLHRGDARSHLANDAGALMAEDRGKDSLAVEAVKGVGVGVADAGRLDFNQDLAGLRALQIKLDDFKQLLCFERDSGTCLHSKLHFRFSRYRKNILSPNSAHRQRTPKCSSLAHAGILGLLRGGRLVFMLRRPHTTRRVVGAGAQIDVEVVHVAGDVRIVTEGRHDVLLRTADVLAAAGDHAEEVWVAHRLERVLQRRRVGRSHAVGAVADVALRVITAVSRIGVPVDGTVDWYTYSGYRRYHSECHVCHGPDGMGSTYAPALKESLKTMSYADFLGVVASGRKNVSSSQDNVMPAFGDNPNVACYMDDLYVYLRARASDAVGRVRPAKHEDKPPAAQQAR